ADNAREYKLHTRLIGLDGGSFIEVDHQPHPFFLDPLLVIVKQGSRQDVQSNSPGKCAGRFRQCEKAVGDVHCFMDACGCRFRECDESSRQAWLRSYEGEIAADYGVDIVELVSDSAGKSREALQPLDPVELRLNGLLLRDVSSDGCRPRNPSLLIADRGKGQGNVDL